MQALYFILGLVVITLLIVLITQCCLSVTKVFHLPKKSHLYNVIDTSHYFTRLNSQDLKARRATSQEDYIKIYKSHLTSFNSTESKQLTDVIRELNENYLYKFKNLYKIPWNLVKFKDVEENYPHTLGDVIFLPETFFTYEPKRQMETILHEKIHVYQRMYPIETSKLIRELGFEVFNSQANIPLIRSNPDTDAFVYKLNNTVQAAVFPNPDPTSIKDAQVKMLQGDNPWNFGPTILQLEHPFEIMACMIPQIVLGKLKHPKVEEWMQVNL